MVEGIETQNAVLLGRGTYQAWAAFWPTAPAELLFTHFISPVHKYVVSTTLSDVEQWQPTTVLTGNIPQTITQLKQQSGKNIGVQGLTLIRSLLDWDLWDELNLAVFPVLLGGVGVCSTMKIASKDCASSVPNPPKREVCSSLTSRIGPSNANWITL